MRLGLLQRNHQPYQELGNQMSHSFPATLLATTLLLAASAAHSQAPAAQHVSTGIDASDDSDGFREYKPWAQYEAANGWGLRAAWQHYSINDWSATGRSLYLTHRAQQGAWSSNGRVGLNRSAGHSHLVGAWDGMYQFTAQTAAGMSVERDVVNSQRGLERGLTATTAVAVLDHQLHPRLSLGLAAGSTWFSDDNRRDVLRSRWTFTLHEPQGWYAYAITRHYQNSKPYQGAYFAPERFREAALGLLWKKAVSDHLVISANADWGRQYIEGQGQRLWHWGLYLSSPHRAAIQWKVGISSSKDHASSLNGGDTSYRYTSAVAHIRIPF